MAAHLVYCNGSQNPPEQHMVQTFGLAFEIHEQLSKLQVLSMKILNSEKFQIVQMSPPLAISMICKFDGFTGFQDIASVSHVAGIRKLTF